MSSEAPESPLKERLLEAALAALLELTPAALLSAIGTREIARRAGGSPASINHHYGSLQGLADAVVDHVYGSPQILAGGVSELLGHVRHSHLPLETAFGMHGAEFDRNTSDPEFRHRVGLWAFGGAQATQGYRDYLRKVTEQLEIEAGRLFESWGRTLRPPFDLRSYLEVKTALLNGMTVRNLVDPQPGQREHFQRATVALDLVALRIEGDRHAMDDRLTEMNYYPLTNAGRAGQTERSDTTRSRILHAAAEQFTTRGYEETALSRVAAQADVSPSTLNRYFATKDDLAVALFRQQAADLLPASPDRDDPREGLAAHLATIAHFTVPRVAYAAPYLADLLTTPPTAEEDPLMAGVQARVARLDPSTSGTDPADPTDLAESAELLLALTLRRVILQPATPPERVAAEALRRTGV
ncbi:TetR family transcriptional regulator [Nocardioides sp.]|uniref:TetR family transcriptional regulator n=1 Tax=Nocardioides sp. TaxID=35761 RepID=UPI00351910D3